MYFFFPSLVHYFNNTSCLVFDSSIFLSFSFIHSRRNRPHELPNIRKPEDSHRKSKKFMTRLFSFLFVFGMDLDSRVCVCVWTRQMLLLCDDLVWLYALLCTLHNYFCMTESSDRKQHAFLSLSLALSLSYVIAIHLFSRKKPFCCSSCLIICV